MLVRAEPHPALMNTYPKVVQVNAHISAHLQESGGARVVKEDVHRDFAVAAGFLEILKDIQVREGVCNYGDHLQWKITETIQ